MVLGKQNGGLQAGVGSHSEGVGWDARRLSSMLSTALQFPNNMDPGR